MHNLNGHFKSSSRTILLAYLVKILVVLTGCAEMEDSLTGNGARTSRSAGLFLEPLVVSLVGLEATVEDQRQTIVELRGLIDIRFKEEAQDEQWESFMDFHRWHARALSVNWWRIEGFEYEIVSDSESPQLMWYLIGTAAYPEDPRVSVLDADADFVKQHIFDVIAEVVETFRARPGNEDRVALGD